MNLELPAVKVSVVDGMAIELVFVADEVITSPNVQGVSKGGGRYSLQRSRSSLNENLLPFVFVGSVSENFINWKLSTAQCVYTALAGVIVNIAKCQDKLLVSGSASVVDSTGEISSDIGPGVRLNVISPAVLSLLSTSSRREVSTMHKDGVSLWSVHLEGHLISVNGDTGISGIGGNSGPHSGKEVERPKIIVRSESSVKTAKEIEGVSFNGNTSSHSNARSSIGLNDKSPSVGRGLVSPKISVELEVRESGVVSKTTIHHNTVARIPIVGSHENSNWRRHSWGNLSPLVILSIILPGITKVDVITGGNVVIEALVESSPQHQSFVYSTKNSSGTGWRSDLRSISFPVPFGFFGSIGHGEN